MTLRKAVRLADLEQSCGEVLLRSKDGTEREISVRPIDSRGEQLRHSMIEGTGATGDLWKLAALLLPDATPEEIELLTPTGIGVVVQMACGHLEQVLQLAEAAGKAAAANPAPPSAPAIG